jgi:hypothetical protein
MKPVHKHIFCRFLWLALLLALFNCRMDVAVPDNVSGHLSLNEAESIVGFIFGDVLGMEDAMAEHDKNERGGVLNLEKEVEFGYYLAAFKEAGCCYNVSCGHNKYENLFIPQFHPELTPPPPKA